MPSAVPFWSNYNVLSTSARNKLIYVIFLNIRWAHLSDIDDAGSKKEAEAENGDDPTHPNWCSWAHDEEAGKEL